MTREPFRAQCRKKKEKKKKNLAPVLISCFLHRGRHYPTAPSTRMKREKRWGDGIVGACHTIANDSREGSVLPTKERRRKRSTPHLRRREGGKGKKPHPYHCTGARGHGSSLQIGRGRERRGKSHRSLFRPIIRGKGAQSTGERP